MCKRWLRIAVAGGTVVAGIGVYPCIAQQFTPLTDQQVQSAIDLGRAGEIPTVKVSSFGGDFDVVIDGPIARIAAAASAATHRYKPFSIRDVTAEMGAPVYVVSLRRRPDSRTFGAIQNIVLEPNGSTSVETAIQPVRQLAETATFDRLPEGEFEVIVVSASERQRYRVSLKDRARLDRPASNPPESSAPSQKPQSAIDAASALGGRPLRMSIQGDGPRHAEAVRALEDELRAAGVQTVVVQRSEPYDYMIILGEGRAAAAAMALDSQGNVVAQAVRTAMTERGAVDGASHELGKKLAARSR